mmetsp:Transcript_9115/g.18984  ORF Transcript_9115/g.18984 Transcript_9115/m.18984 type:complete len:370 (+) Transcript_9115:155-1264(+)
MGKVDILLEILKPPTAAKAVSLEDMPYFSHNPSFEMEYRDPPPNEHLSYEFVGSPYGHHMSLKEVGTPANRVRFNEHELYEAQLQRNHQRISSDEVNPYDKGCMFEFFEYLCSIVETFKFDCTKLKSETKKGELLDMKMKDAEASKVALEMEMRSQLLEIQRQKEEMEFAYHEEMAREFSERISRQTQLEEKLLSIVEQRLAAELQLGRLNISRNVIDVTPTVVGTPVHNEEEVSGRDKFSHLRALMTPHVEETTSAVNRKAVQVARPSLRVNLEAPAVTTTSDLPFSPTHHFSPAFAENSKSSFFKDSETTHAVAKPSSQPKRNRKGPSLSIVTEGSSEMSHNMSDEALPTATPVHNERERGVIEVFE